MLRRAEFPRQKDIMLITDIPVKSEIESGEKFSSASNLNFLTALRTGRVNNYDNSPSNHKGITANKIYTTYLSYERFEEGNFDFKNDFKKRNQLKPIILSGKEFFIEKIQDEKVVTEENIHEFQYHKLQHQKDCYVSDTLYNQIENLIEEIRKVSPKLIIISGKWTLFFLVGNTTLGTNMPSARDTKPLGGLNTFRASILHPHDCWNLNKTVIFPIIHPVNINIMPDKIFIFEWDLKKVSFVYQNILDKGLDFYDKVFEDKYSLFEPDKSKILSYLSQLTTKLDNSSDGLLISCDIETMFLEYIDCVGITDNIYGGVCIPFATADNPNLWTFEEELELFLKLKEILTHPKTRLIGQNFMYDCLVIWNQWGIVIHPYHDTMILHHKLYNHLPKNLAFLASIYVDNYTYWKDEIDATKESPETRWLYNIKDICYTLEVLQNQLEVFAAEDDVKLWNLYRFEMEKLHIEVQRTVTKGVLVDLERKKAYYDFFNNILSQIPEKLNQMLGFEFNPNSHPQKKKLFAEYFGITLVKKKLKEGGYTETCDAAAMLQYIEDYPEYATFLSILIEYSTLSKFTSTFLGMLLDEDNRARTQYKITGTDSGRFASTKNIWKRGANFQNLPTKGKLPIKYLLDLVKISQTKDTEDKEDWLDSITNLLQDEEFTENT